MKFRCFIEPTGKRSANVRLGTLNNPGTLRVPIEWSELSDEPSKQRLIALAKEKLEEHFKKSVAQGYSAKFMLTGKV